RRRRRSAAGPSGRYASSMVTLQGAPGRVPGDFRTPRPAMTPAIIRRQIVLEELDVAPDGRFAVVVRRAVDRADRYVSHLWLLPLAKGAGRGVARDQRPGPGHPPTNQPGWPSGRLPPQARRRQGRGPDAPGPGHPRAG